MEEFDLIQKYNTPGPRYTSYPTVVYWDDSNFSAATWKDSVLKCDDQLGGMTEISLYIHLPFCESLCTFCGCNKRITKNHDVETPYIKALLKEWKMYVSLTKKRPVIREIHLGGGTPTFFSEKNLALLIEGLLDLASVSAHASFSFEGHPENTTTDHLLTLYNYGFRRVSYGIQCFDPKVQKAIHRVQSFEQVEHVTQISRNIGYTSINYDVIYGLPFQTNKAVRNTIKDVIKLRPDRIAFYSYAHVPWIKGNGQRKFKKEDLPIGREKLEMYAAGKELLLRAGYKEIGMDHFALPSDDLYAASIVGTLHRNFMGYSTTTSKLMIGLGVSAISDSWYGFAQNEKTLEAYLARIQSDELPVFRGHSLTTEDLEIRQHILDIMCKFETTYPQQSEILHRLAEPLHDNLIRLADDRIVVTEKGRPYIRNVCMAFDQRLWDNKPQTQLFSMTI